MGAFDVCSHDLRHWSRADRHGRTRSSSCILWVFTLACGLICLSSLWTKQQVAAFLRFGQRAASARSFDRLAFAGTSGQAVVSSGRSLRFSDRLDDGHQVRHAVDSDDGDAPYVRWTPPLNFSVEGELEPTPGALTLPCFPLGGVAYMPEQEETLNIFEPRYRQMYSDILFSGGRRFVVPQVTQDPSGAVRLTGVGVVFYLKELREVSEETNDQVKYVCQHSVIGRVRLKRVLNPAAFADRSTYLRVECEDMQDTDEDVDCSASETQLLDTLGQLAAVQKSSDAHIKFREEHVQQMNATRGAPFWSIVKLWQGYLYQRVARRQQEFEDGVREAIVNFFKEAGKPIPKQFSLQEMPPDVQKEVMQLQNRFKEEAEPLMEAQFSAVQLLVQCDSHAERLRLLADMMSDDRRRLEAEQALKSIFSETSDGE